MIASFHMNVRNHGMWEEMAINKVRDIAELYALANKCAHAEEGRRFPGEDPGAAVDSEDDDASTPKKKGRKRKGKAVLAVEGLGNPGKKPKAEGTDKEVAVCTYGHEAAAGEKTDGPYYKIHCTAGHDLQECRQVEHLAKKQKHEYKKRDNEKGQSSTGGSGKKNHGACGGPPWQGQAAEGEACARSRQERR
jgi:hypothetical protein